MRTIVGIIAGLLLLGASSVLAQDLAASVVGVWKVKTFEVEQIETKKITKPYGEKPSGFFVFTKTRFFSITLGSDRKPPAAASPTDAERVELFKSMSATAGVYTVEGGKVTITYDGAWNPQWIGTTQIRAVEISGTTMTFKSLTPVASALSGVKIIFTAVLEKVE